MQFKKVICSLLVVILLLSMAVITASADETKTMDLAVETTSTAGSDGKYIVKGGDEIEVSVTIASNPGAAYLQFDLKYDATALTPVSADGKVAVESNIYSFENILGKDGIIASEGKITFISNVWNATNVAETGKLATLKFKVADGYHGETAVEIEGLKAFTTVDGKDVKLDTKTTAVSFSAHVLGEAVVTAPTCTTEGNTTVKCTKCDYTVVSDVKEATGHTEVVLPAVEPTETTEGKTEGKECSVCGEVLVPQDVVPKLAPKESDSETEPPVDEPANLTWLWIVIAVVVVAGAGVAVFFVLKNKKKA